MKSIPILSLLALLTVASPLVSAQTPNAVYKGERLELERYWLPKLEDLEEGCTYALLTGGYQAEFIEFIRFTAWKRIVVTIESGTSNSDRYLVRRYDHKSGTLFNSPEVASLQAACDAALDKKLTQQEPPETGDDEMILVVARKKDGKLTCRTTILTSEIMEPEFRDLMVQLYGIKKKLNPPAVNQSAAPSQVAPQQAPVPLAPDASPKQMTPPSSP